MKFSQPLSLLISTSQSLFIRPPALASHVCCCYLVLTINQFQIIKYTCHSFCYASPYLWNELPLCLHQPHFPDQSPPTSLFLLMSFRLFSFFFFIFTYHYIIVHHSFTLSLKLKTHLFHESFPPQTFCTHQTDFTVFYTLHYRFCLYLFFH